jgi:hypothetical protein
MNLRCHFHFSESKALRLAARRAAGGLAEPKPLQRPLGSSPVFLGHAFRAPFLLVNSESEFRDQFVIALSGSSRCGIMAGSKFRSIGPGAMPVREEAGILLEPRPSAAASVRCFLFHRTPIRCLGW